MAEFNAGNLYDINKQLVEASEHELQGLNLWNRMDQIVAPYFDEKLATDNYFMLLCHEKRDFTVFHFDDPEAWVMNHNTYDITRELESCLKARGAIFAIDRTEDNEALEIWLRYAEDNTMVCYYLFPYTQGVIEFEG